MHDITYHGPGNRAVGLEVGDFILTRGENWYSKAIRFGQGFNRRVRNGPVTEINHAALSVGGDGLSEALSDGIVRTNLEKYDDFYYAAIRLDLPYSDQLQIMRYVDASETGQVKYGWLTIVSLALTMATGCNLNFGVNGTMICSGYVGQALVRAGEIFEHTDANFVTPADLVEKYRSDIPGL